MLFSSFGPRLMCFLKKRNRGPWFLSCLFTDCSWGSHREVEKTIMNTFAFHASFNCHLNHRRSSLFTSAGRAAVLSTLAWVLANELVHANAHEVKLVFHDRSQNLQLLQNITLPHLFFVGGKKVIVNGKVDVKPPSESLFFVSANMA